MGREGGKKEEDVEESGRISNGMCKYYARTWKDNEGREEEEERGEGAENTEEPEVGVEASGSGVESERHRRQLSSE